MQSQTHLLGSALGIALILAVVGRVLYVRHQVRAERFEAGRQWARDHLNKGLTFAQAFSTAYRGFRCHTSPFYLGIQHGLAERHKEIAEAFRDPPTGGPKELWNPDFNKPASTPKQ